MALILIVGASKGIGLETAQALGRRGHTVIGTSRKPTDNSLLPLDVTDSNSINQLSQTIKGQPLDAMIYSAGYDLYSAAEDTSIAELIMQLDANFLGAVRMTQAVLPQLRRRGSGKLIYLSSIGGMSALPFNSAYAASKFALEGYAESLRYELLPRNIFVSLIEPGQVRTDTLATSIRSLDGHSQYGVSSEKLAENARRRGEKATLTTNAVASTIVEIVEAHCPRLRYPVGAQARLVLTLRAVLPARLFENIILRQFVHPLI